MLLVYSHLTIFRRRLFTLLSAVSLVLCIVVLWNYANKDRRNAVVWNTWSLHPPAGSRVMFMSHGLECSVCRPGTSPATWKVLRYFGIEVRISEDLGDPYNPHLDDAGVVIPDAATTWVELPYWLLLCILSPLPLIWTSLWARRRFGRITPGLCQKCGYDLRATPDRCPECGQPAITAKTN